MKPIRSLLAVTLVTGAALPAMPAYCGGTLNVCWDGSGDYSEIQPAIEAAANGDTIVVCPGTYHEHIHLRGKAITVTGTDPLDPNIIATTIIDGDDADTVVSFAGSEQADTTLSGFTIRNGNAWDGGGIHGHGAKPTIEYCIIRNNRANSGGGGVFDCDGTLRYCDIRENTAANGGAGFCNCDGLISHCEIIENHGAHIGGGLCWCNASIEYCKVQENAADSGAGLFDCDGQIAHCLIMDNQSDGDGGGLNGCSGVIHDCTISGNQGAGGGGLAYCDELVTKCTITGNAATWGGAGLKGCSARVVDCTISGNRATLYGGGLAECSGAVDRCKVIGNTAGLNGGGVYLQSNVISNSLIAGNRSQWGGGLHNCDEIIINCTIAENWALNDGGGLCDCNWLIRDCIIWANIRGNPPTPNALASCIVPVYCCVEGGPGGVGCIYDDPLFVMPGSWNGNTWSPGDYSVLAGSPSIDAGDNTDPVRDHYDVDGDGCTTDPLPLSLSNRARYHDDLSTPDTGRGAPPIVDMGAYESGSGLTVPSGPCAGDMDCDLSVDFDDINPFIKALANPVGYQQQFPNCDLMNGDINNDGIMNFGDINPFIKLLANP